MTAVAWCGILVGACGIALAVMAWKKAARTAEECAALARASVGSGGIDARAVRDVAIVRYDALTDMSGELSFSVAILSALGDGIVMTSINGRSETRTYAKAVSGGRGVQELSPEEEQAVRTARLGQGLPRPEPEPASQPAEPAGLAS